MLRQVEFRGSLGPRRVWVQDASSRCLVFLDGEFYVERVGAPPIIPAGVTAVYLSFGDPELRRVDFCCNDAFADYLALELVPWIQATIGHPAQFTLCGLSLSGLAAIHAALRHPRVFDRVVSQSPSAWWNDEWLSRNLPSGAGPDVRVSVGAHETSENVGHDHSDLFQVTSQVDSCRNLVADLQRHGHSVEYVEFEGGHDAESWREDLRAALAC